MRFAVSRSRTYSQALLPSPHAVGSADPRGAGGGSMQHAARIHASTGPADTVRVHGPLRDVFSVHPVLGRELRERGRRMLRPAVGGRDAGHVHRVATLPRAMQRLHYLGDRLLQAVRRRVPGVRKLSEDARVLLLALRERLLLGLSAIVPPRDPSSATRAARRCPTSDPGSIG